MSHDTEEWCEIWRKTDLLFQKWQEFVNFCLRSYWDPFIQSRKCMSLRFTEKVCVTALKIDAKFEEELTFRFKIDMKNLINFDPSTGKPQKYFTEMSSFWTKCIMFELKKFRGVMFHDTVEWCKIWRKTDSWLGKWLEEFGKFLPEYSKTSKWCWNRKCMSLKFTVEVCIITMKNDAKFEEELTCRFKIDTTIC